MSISTANYYTAHTSPKIAQIHSPKNQNQTHNNLTYTTTKNEKEKEKKVL
jgi:hypothetical protein